ncbi:MAG: aldehyde dehydrogenase family protein [Lentisphaeria bacterium]|nr:aldehyde dehydrogenase family protein [Lentisphaeria bacterium]
MDGEALRRALADYEAGRKREIVSVPVRRAKLREFARVLARSKAELYAALTADLNRAPTETLLAELLPLLEIVRFLARKLPRLLKPRRLPWSWATFPARSELVREPFGRVLVVSTWNYPLLLALEPALGAYAAGNRVILKLSPRAPHTNGFIRRMLEQTFAADEILLLDDELPLAEALAFRYDYIFLTGSRESGRAALKAAAAYCTPATVELGGKNPCVVAENADLPTAARRIVWGKFFNAGQSCAAPDHLLVHRDVRDDLVNLIRENIRRMYGDHPLDGGAFPAMPDTAAYDRVCALSAGGRLLHGGDRDPEKRAVEPTVIDRIAADSPLLTEEVFAPLLPVLEYASETELLLKLQTQEKPLALYCFGGSAALRRALTEQFSAGAVVFNDVMVHFSNMHIPFGGVGASGFGAYHGERTLTTFTHEKPVVRQGTWLDLPLRYPPYRRMFRKLVEFFCHVR